MQYSNSFADSRHKKQYVIAYAQDNMANDWRARQIKQLQEELAKYPVIKFIYTDAKGSTAKQIHDIEDFMYKKVDILMTSPRDGKLMTPVISKVYNSGIPVILVTRNIESNDFTSFVAPDDREIAKQAATFIADRLNGHGDILILKGVPTATTAIQRTEGFMEEIRKYPGIKIAAVKVANYLRADAIRMMDEVIIEGTKYDAIYAQSDSMASGARLAMIKSGIDPSTKIIVGIDYISEAREAIKNGTQAASFLYPTSAREAASVALDVLHNKKVSKRVNVGTRIITRDNVDEITPIF
ncbi:MAG: substrate-binding domain-containing protein [Gammaproteobacteria bacterium]|nr:substrate-binding domain-containing protein [Gammaproteobacteria bacterium]